MPNRPHDTAPHPDIAIGARAVFPRWQRWLLLAAFALLIACRLPRAWTHGRFLDEEATVFLAYAWHYPWADALFRPFAGYWNFAANATTLLAARLVQSGILSLEHAPYLTMTMALAAQLLPAIFLLTGRATWLQNRAAVIAALLVVAIAPATEEVFLNVIHIQFHLALCVALILAFETPTAIVARCNYAAVLLVAPLCGPAVIIFLPLFALRWWQDRSHARLEQLGVFALGAALQLLLFFGANPMRGHLVDPGMLGSMLLVRLIVMPLLGWGKAGTAADAINDARMAGEHGWLWAPAMASLLLIALVTVAMRRRDAAIWLVLAGLGAAIVAFDYGMVVVDSTDLLSVGAGERYNFLPVVSLGLSLVVLAMREGRARLLFILLCLMFLMEGTVRYRKPIDEVGRGPSWPIQVALWRANHDHPLRVWPRPVVADLSDHKHECTPIGRDITRSDDPRYCESGWVAGYFRPRAGRDLIIPADHR